MRKVFLAADSGGSKTIWSLIDENGTELFSMVTEGLGAVKEGILPIKATVEKAAKSINSVAIPIGIHLSLGGPNTSEVLNALKEQWKNIPIQVEREACGDSILYAAKFLGCDSVVMCGTGSTAVGNTQKGRCFAGGWGPIYGDGGSGGGIGSDALKLFLRYLDGMEDIGELSVLFNNITDGLNVNEFADRMEAKQRAIDMSRRELASLSPRIYDLMEKGDATCEKLYDKAAKEVADMAYSVSDDEQDAKILLCGGFFKNTPLFLEKCKKIFSQKSQGELCYYPKFSPIVGAKITVLNNNMVYITNEIFEKIYDNMEE